MSRHHRGFVCEQLKAPPDGYPHIGYEFEFSFPPRGPQSSDFGNIDIFTYRVTGWEKQVDELGNDRISVRVLPISKRVRRVTSISLDQCNLGHTHTTFTYDDDSSLKGKVPEIWGY